MKRNTKIPATVIHADTSPAPPPPPSRLLLNSPGRVARFLARITRESYLGSLDSGKAAKLAYLCTVLLSALESADLESRIERLEKEGRP